ncbi:MAG: zinc-ribbon domain-containing protein [Spirochaetales bacterium]
MYCRNCGKELFDDAYVCLRCGTAVPENFAKVKETVEVPENKFCPNCGKEIDKNAYICINCGAKIQNDEKTSNIDNGKTLGIIGIIFALIIPLVTWICSGIGLSRANKAGDESSQTLNIVALIISVFVFLIVLLINVYSY